jgi:hypothetical protein
MNERSGNGAGFGNSGYCAGVDISSRELNSATQVVYGEDFWTKFAFLQGSKPALSDGNSLCGQATEMTSFKSGIR